MEDFNVKKIIALLIVLVSLVPVASAEIDLSSLSYNELVTLRDQINLAIWKSEEWQEVEVPQGVWVVGEDIPAGKWTIKAADGLTAYVYWCDKLDEAGTSPSWMGSIYEYESLSSQTHKYYQKGDSVEVTWELKNGHYFIVDSGIALFTPYAGKPSLGFK